MTRAQKNPLSLVEGGVCRRRERINLWVHACHSISLFSIVVSNFLFFFIFFFFSRCFLLSYCDFFLKITITRILIPPLLCKARVLYIVLAVTGFYHFSPKPPLSGLDVLADHHWFVNRLAITTYLCWLCHSSSLNEECCFVCLFAMAFLPVTM